MDIYYWNITVADPDLQLRGGGGGGGGGGGAFEGLTMNDDSSSAQKMHYFQKIRGAVCSLDLPLNYTVDVDRPRTSG